MEIIDANIILRYLLNDNASFFVEAQNIVENRQVQFPNEVCAEVVYVLQKVYNIPRNEIANSITTILDYPNISANKLVLKEALKIYEYENIDFVDSVLVANNHEFGTLIHTFDNKIKKLCR